MKEPTLLDATVFGEGIDEALTQIHDLRADVGLEGWLEYVVIRKPGDAKSIIVVACAEDEGDFNDALMALHRSEANKGI